MPFIESADLRLNYRFDGPQRPVISSFQFSRNEFVHVGPAGDVLCEKFCVLRYDTRGHGLSSATPGPYSIEQLGRDVITLLDALKVESAYFCGLSMGGMIGMWLGVNAASRMKGLVLCSAAAKIGTADTWNARIKEVKERGMAAIATMVVLRWFSEDFVKKSPEVIEAMRQMLLQAPTRRLCGVLCGNTGRGLEPDLSRVTARTLVIAGAQDPVISPADAHLVAEGIPGASYLNCKPRICRT